MLLLQTRAEQAEEYKKLAKKYHAGFELMDFSFASELEKLKQPQYYEKLKAAYNNAPIYSCHGVFADLNFSGSDPWIYEMTEKRIRQCVETGKQMGITRYVFHSCFHPTLQPEDPLYKIWSRTAAKLFQTLVEEYDITVYLENVLDTRPEILLGIMQEAENPRIQVCFDVGHANLTKTPLEHWIEILHPYIKYVHLSDNRGIYDDHIAPGDGTIPWQLFGRLVQQYEIKADYTIEVNGLDQVEKSCRRIQEGLLPINEIGGSCPQHH